ncbi:hypothetical protein CWIS_06060 [Cellulomonas sp. A375-1]|uniref:lipopolysaccharide assembly protein LapA domain-containing protein n=1 Tax=Cellulomonas sp. A375-1 TaxID=1672219 RepID=UPI000652735C|nr:LapA family protein [Cellulomonas sp. A375-1]KMM46292.1 hypothetical protein CWIS_06060 [Cellulomonas sp. A375-1]
MSAGQQPVESKPVPWRPILGLIVLAAALVLIFQNADEYPVHLFWTSVTMPLWILLAITFVLGVVVGWMLKTRRARRNR